MKDEYFAISGIVGVILTLLIHYLFFSNLKISYTLHVAIGLGLFFILSVILSTILKRFSKD